MKFKKISPEETEEVIERIQRVVKFAADLSQEANQDPADAMMVLLGSAIWLGRTCWPDMPQDRLEYGLQQAIHVYMHGRPN